MDHVEDIRRRLAGACLRANSREFNKLWAEEVVSLIRSPLDMVITVDEAASILGVSRFTVHRLIRSEKIEARRTSGGVWLILRASLPSPW